MPLPSASTNFPLIITVSPILKSVVDALAVSVVLDRSAGITVMLVASGVPLVPALSVTTRLTTYVPTLSGVKAGRFDVWLIRCAVLSLGTEDNDQSGGGAPPRGALLALPLRVTTLPALTF